MTSGLTIFFTQYATALDFSVSAYLIYMKSYIGEQQLTGTYSSFIEIYQNCILIWIVIGGKAPAVKLMQSL